MRKFLIIALVLSLLVPACALAEDDYLLDIGPYTYDASGCNVYSYYSQNMLGVDYPTLEAYRGFGIGAHYVQLQYYTYPQLGTSYQELVSYYGTTSNWDIAYYDLESYYGQYTGSDTYLSYEAEEVNPLLSPACALFTSAISDNYGGGCMAGALFATPEGMLFFECYSFTGDKEITRSFRDNMLSRLSYEGECVVTDEADPDAPADIPVELTGQPVSVDIGTGKGYTLDLEGYIRLENDPLTITATYDNLFLSACYWPFNTMEVGKELADLSPAKAAARFFENDYKANCGEGLVFESIEMENKGDMPLLFNGITNEDYGGGYVLGAILVDDTGVLTIDVMAYDDQAYYDDLEFFREDLLDQLTDAQ